MQKKKGSTFEQNGFQSFKMSQLLNYGSFEGNVLVVFADEQCTIVKIIPSTEKDSSKFKSQDIDEIIKYGSCYNLDIDRVDEYRLQNSSCKVLSNFSDCHFSEYCGYRVFMLKAWLRIENYYESTPGDSVIMYIDSSYIGKKIHYKVDTCNCTNLYSKNGMVNILEFKLLDDYSRN